MSRTLRETAAGHSSKAHSSARPGVGAERQTGGRRGWQAEHWEPLRRGRGHWLICVAACGGLDSGGQEWMQESSEQVRAEGGGRGPGVGR